MAESAQPQHEPLQVKANTAPTIIFLKVRIDITP